MKTELDGLSAGFVITFLQIFPFHEIFRSLYNVFPSNMYPVGKRLVPLKTT